MPQSARGTMKSRAVALGVIFLLLAVIMLVFASGLRRWYSGLFFSVIGTATLLNAFYRGGAAEEWAGRQALQWLVGLDRAGYPPRLLSPINGTG